MTDVNTKAEINTKAVIEAMLFTTERPLLAEQIKKVLNLNPTEVKNLINELNSEYQQQARGFRIIEIAGGFQMITPIELAPFLKKMYKERRIERLSKPALETLAIIAYKQPLTKAEIQSLRSVNVDGVIKSLLEKNFIRVVGKKDSPGRPLVLGTTREFLEYFALKSLEDLPKMEDFSAFAQKEQEKHDQPQNLENQTPLTEVTATEQTSQDEVQVETISEQEVKGQE